jgi:uncharacterized damage-inducible protein DinB
MEDIWRQAFLKGLQGKWSYPNPFEVLDGIDVETAGKRVEGMPHTIWQIAWHMSQWAWVILKKFQGIEVKQETPWNNFFLEDPAPPSKDVWNKLNQDWKNYPKELDASLSKFKPEITFPEWDNIDAAHLLMVIITHTSYHTAQIVALRRMLGKWDKKP